MSSNLYGQFTGVPMDADAIDDLLVSTGWGVLSLCRSGGEPYSIPVSFGYDGDRVYFGLLEVGEESAKLDAIDEGATARLLVTAVRGRFDWQSVAITGPVHPIEAGSEAWEHLMDTLDDNAWFMRSFERADDVDAIHGWALEVESLQGLERREEVYD